MPPTITLIPLNSEHHADALQQVYRAAPSFWERYGILTAPDGQALRDLQEAESIADRTMMGIVRRSDQDDPEAGYELIGLVDFRLHWPVPDTAYLGMILVAEPMQRQGVGTQAWRLLADWLRGSTDIGTMRLGVEQNNPVALHFFQHLGFTLTGETNRISVGDKWLRLLYMEQILMEQSLASGPDG